MTQPVNQQGWGLEKSPFGGGLDTRLFFEGATQREALARLRFLRANGRLGLVDGPAGSGKSLLLRMFEQDCRRSGFAVAQLNMQGLSPREFTWELGNQLGTAGRIEEELPQLFRQLADRLAENALQDIETILFLDDLHEAGPDLLGQVVRIAKLDLGGDRPLAMVLSSVDHALDWLPTSLAELVDLRVQLEAWDELDTIGYLQLALVEAGSSQPLFDDHSLSEIHRLSGGVPRQVKRLADYALLIGSATAPEIIDCETIRAAHQVLNPEPQP